MKTARNCANEHVTIRVENCSRNYVVAEADSRAAMIEQGS